MSYKIAGIDVHKKMLAVVVSDVEIESEYQFERAASKTQRRPSQGRYTKRKVEAAVSRRVLTSCDRLMMVTSTDGVIIDG